MNQIYQHRPLEGKRAWIITDGKQGMDVQVRGVADALGVDYEMKYVAPRGVWRLLAPWAPVAPDENFADSLSPFTPPWPDIALATGRLSIPYMRALGRCARCATYRIVLQDPKTRPTIADLIWVPQHDRRRGSNVITTLTAPHSFSQQRLEALRGTLPREILDLPPPRIGVILGGPNAIYRFRQDDIDRFRNGLVNMLPTVGSFLLTPSRRTPEALLSAAVEATDGAPRQIWSGEGTNPYPHYLAGADGLIVTADSVNMVGEAAATGRPVYVFHPAGGSAKFERFHDALRRYGATRPLAHSCSGFETWSYKPLDSAHVIAAEVERRWLACDRHHGT